jgi:NAD(P)-dependent dehydrogenase (short-subunit alcohol dehydrogenase family)
MSLEGKKIFVAGGTSGIGLAVARGAIERGAGVIVASRNKDKREQAQAELGNGASVIEMDVTDDKSVSEAFAGVGALDHVVCTAPGAAVGPIAQLDTATAQAAYNAKFWGAFRVAKYAEIREGGTLTLISGQMARRPRKGLVMGGCVNTAVEALAKGLASELAPVRVNAVSPGFIDTPLHARLSDQARSAAFKNASDNLPVHRPGRPEDIASMIFEIMQNGFLTGSVIQVDGGAVVI